MQIVVNGLMTHYQRQGSGKTVLLLHGWGDRLETFSALIPLLAKNYEVVALDLPGFGQTQAPSTAWKLEDYSEFTRAFINKLEVPTLHGVIGHSNGGAVAIKAVADRQLEPAKLILLAAAGIRDSHKLKKTGLKLVAKTGKAATFWLPKASKQKLQKKFYGTIGSDMLAAPHMQETFKQTVRQDIQADAAKLSLPALLIYGDQDKATPLSSIGQPLHKLIKGSELKVITGADHFVHQSASEEVGREILEFLK